MFRSFFYRALDLGLHLTQLDKIVSYDNRNPDESLSCYSKININSEIYIRCVGPKISNDFPGDKKLSIYFILFYFIEYMDAGK